MNRIQQVFCSGIQRQTNEVKHVKMAIEPWAPARKFAISIIPATKCNNFAGKCCPGMLSGHRALWQAKQPGMAGYKTKKPKTGEKN